MKFPEITEKIIVALLKCILGLDRECWRAFTKHV